MSFGISQTDQRDVFTAVDLFCGSGAVTEGLRNTGFNVVAAVDNDPIARQTYVANHPSVRFFCADIRLFDPQAIIKAIPSETAIDLLVFCAPCQPFSSQNRKRGFDQRSTLLLQAGRFAQALKPKCILFENVPGLTTRANEGIVELLRAELQAKGYALSVPLRVDAADLGVPQRRVRCVMLAAPSTSVLEGFNLLLPKGAARTVRDVIGGLRPLRAGESDPGDHLHRARTHRPVALERLRAIPTDGGSRSSLPSHLRLKCHKDDHSFSDVYGRMRWDDVSPTLTTGCDDITRGRFAHPDQDRGITLREAALLQTFPRNYMFSGSRSDIARQIGNAVPVAMVEGLAPAIKHVIMASRRPDPPARPVL